MSKLFAFLDLETTGLSPEDDFIVEVAWQLTDGEFNQLGDPKSFIVDHGGDFGEVIETIRGNRFVRDMHVTSGLLQDMITSPLAVPLQDIADVFVADLLEYDGAASNVHLAGYSVGFDRSFMQANHEFAPLFTGKSRGLQIHHRLLDLSANILMWQSAGRPSPVTENPHPHRALYDVLDTVEFAQLMRSDLLS